jgi:hypothetical protein
MVIINVIQDAYKYSRVRRVGQGKLGWEQLCHVKVVIFVGKSANIGIYRIWCPIDRACEKTGFAEGKTAVQVATSASIG